MSRPHQLIYDCYFMAMHIPYSAEPSIQGHSANMNYICMLVFDKNNKVVISVNITGDSCIFWLVEV